MGFGKDGRGVIIRQSDVITLGTLGAKTVLKQDTPIVITEDFRMLKAELFVSIVAATFDDLDGPLVIGIANDELSVTEIKECLEAGGPVGRDDAVGNEQALRAVWPIAHIMNAASENSHALMAQQMPLTVKPRWTFSNANGWTIFVYNQGSSVLATGGIIQLLNKFYGVWVT